MKALATNDPSCAARMWRYDQEAAEKALKQEQAQREAALKEAKKERTRAIKLQEDLDARKQAQKAMAEECESKCNMWRDEKRSAVIDSREYQRQKKAAEEALWQEQAQREALEREIQRKAEENAELEELIAKQSRALKRNNVLLSPDNVR